jgi:hypothetical protein
MNYPNANWFVQSAISADADNAGTPALAVGTDESIYFAISSKQSSDTSYNITIGKLDKTGALLWKSVFPELTSTTDDSRPSIVVGAANELFVAFETQGAVPGRTNMADVPNFCSDCSVPGYADIVLARINQVGNTPSVAWVIQDARLNSCVNETAPQVAIDTKNRLLYMTWQSARNIQCYPSIGTNNIIVSCFGYSSTQHWIEAGVNINGAGTNTNPVIAASQTGTVAVAWEITQAVAGGATPTGVQVEVVSFQTNVGNPSIYNRSWTGSSISNIFATGLSYSPSISSSPEGIFYLAFLTEGVVPGGIRTSATQDLVVASYRVNGTLNWLKQGPLYNSDSITYSNASSPYMTTDRWGNPYLSLITNDSNVLLYRINYANGQPYWTYSSPSTPIYNAYGYALSGAPFGVFPTAFASYSKTPIVVNAKTPTVATSVAPPLAAPGQTHTATGNDLVITNMKQLLYMTNTTPYEYIIDNKIICGCSCVC